MYSVIEGSGLPTVFNLFFRGGKMNLNLYSIYDRKMNIYLTPFPARGDVDAKRQVSASFADPSMASTPAGQHPDDFDLIKIGEFDDESGKITACHPLVLSNLEALKASGTVLS